MFGGGRADLVLIDPDRLLETGIDIVARLLARSCKICSFFRWRACINRYGAVVCHFAGEAGSVCVLDEVEAALDEANVVRFAQYLREFSEQTQFIVVTHRKGTMEEADVLYGVTMEEGGVSKLVSRQA